MTSAELKIGICIFFLSGWLCFGMASAQVEGLPVIPDSVPVAASINSPDTIHEQADSVPTGEKVRKSREGALFDSIEARANRRLWSRKLHNIVVVSSRKKPLRDTLGIEQGETPFIDYEGRIIRKIRFVKLDPFGREVFELKDHSINWAQKTVNRFHVNTRDWVIREHLLIQTGDVVNPSEISDNERILREMASVQDARIFLKPVSALSDSVDVEVVIKDQISNAFGFEMETLDKWNLELWNRSIFGTGHEVQGAFDWNTPEDPQLGSDAYYRIPNIAGSFIDGRVGFMNHYDKESYFVNLVRSFFTPNIRYAGGLNMAHTWALRTLLNPDSAGVIIPVEYNSYNFWVARSFQVPEVNWFTRGRSTFILSGGLNIEQFSERPVIGEYNLYPFHNRRTFLVSIAFSEQKFYKTNLIYSFGQTEDIPAGSLLKFTAGPEINEFSTRFYSSMSLSKGNFIGNVGYLYQSFSIGGFYSKGEINQGILSYEAKGFTNLFLFRRSSFRQFITYKYVLGVNRFEDEYLDLNNGNGIRGFDSRTVLGQQKMVANLETVMFTPYNLVGFRLTLFGFADMGLIGASSPLILKQNAFYGLGGGFRLRNEHLVFNTLQVRFAWYPICPDGVNPTMIHFSGESRFRPANFYVKAPEILKFN
jgi:hypothetical protein